MASETEIKVKNAISSLLSLQFESTPLDLGTRERVDGWIKLSEKKLLILEVENMQNHPDTNVLKVWRFLDTKPDISVILVHVFFPDSKCILSSRGKLASWLGKKLEDILPHQFKYERLVIDRTYSIWTEGSVELLKSSLEAVRIFV